MTELAVSISKTHRGLSYDQIEDEAEKVEKYLYLKDFVERLKKGYLIAIISAEYFNVVEKIAKELGIKDFFLAIKLFSKMENTQENFRIR